MNISLMQKRIAWLFLFLVMFLAGRAEILRDTLPIDSLGEQQYVQFHKSPVQFTYKNVRDYIFSNLSYPAQAVEQEIEGTVLIRFTLMKSGDIDSIRVIAPVHPLLDAEAVRLIRSMPKWQPLYWQGQPVALSYEVPVIFELLPPETKQNCLE